MPVVYFEQPNKNELMQGDVLERTPELNAILEEVHPYYSDEKNRYFMVLTQTCDLVERQFGSVKAPYVVLSPVRVLSIVLDHLIAECGKLQFNCEVPILRERSRNNFNELLERLLNNNDPHHFYLNAKDTVLENACVAILRLSVAIRAPLHLNTCKNSKILQLREIFQTKLGWLIGQLYSRVATDDCDLSELSDKKRRITKDIAVWAADENFEDLERSLLEQFPNHSENAVDRASVAKLIKSLPTKRKKLSARIGEIVRQMEPEVDKSFNYRASGFRRVIERIGADLDNIKNSDYPDEERSQKFDQLKNTLDIIIMQEFAKSNTDSRQLLQRLSSRISSDSEVISLLSR